MTLLFVLAPLGLALAAILVLGYLAFATEGRAARRRSNRLMQWRVWVQLATVLFLVATLSYLGA